MDRARRCPPAGGTGTAEWLRAHLQSGSRALDSGCVTVCKSPNLFGSHAGIYNTGLASWVTRMLTQESSDIQMNPGRVGKWGTEARQGSQGRKWGGGADTALLPGEESPCRTWALGSPGDTGGSGRWAAASDSVVSCFLQMSQWLPQL